MKSCGPTCPLKLTNRGRDVNFHRSPHICVETALDIVRARCAGSVCADFVLWRLRGPGSGRGRSARSRGTPCAFSPWCCAGTGCRSSGCKRAPHRAGTWYATGVSRQISGCLPHPRNHCQTAELSGGRIRRAKLGEADWSAITSHSRQTGAKQLALPCGWAVRERLEQYIIMMLFE